MKLNSEHIRFVVGVLNPANIRPAPEGGYEMGDGQRSFRAAEL